MAGIPEGPRTDPSQRGSDTLATASAALLYVSVDLAPGGPVVVLAGELDVATAPAVMTVCLETFDVHRNPRVVVDVASLSFCDCAGLSMFLRVHKWALIGGGWVRLCHTDRRLRKVLNITGLVSTLHSYPTAADAFADVGRNGFDQR
jgi:anti-sigma B factor antagonist